MPARPLRGPMNLHEKCFLPTTDIEISQLRITSLQIRNSWGFNKWGKVGNPQWLDAHISFRALGHRRAGASTQPTRTRKAQEVEAVTPAGQAMRLVAVNNPKIFLDHR